MKTVRKYGFKDVELLLASLLVCDHFENHKLAFIAIRPGWADPFIGNFRTRIEDAIHDYLGADAKKGLRTATQMLLLVQRDAMDKLSIFKVQVEDDYMDDPAKRDLHYQS